MKKNNSKDIFNKTSLFAELKKENIHYFNCKLKSSRGMIVHYEDITAIVIDESQCNTSASFNTTLLEELGHYYSGSYYRTNSDYEAVSKAEFKADIASWEKYFPYKKIQELIHSGLTSATEIAEYFDVEPNYMSRCLNYYYNKYNGFN